MANVCISSAGDHKILPEQHPGNMAAGLACLRTREIFDTRYNDRGDSIMKRNCSTLLAGIMLLLGCQLAAAGNLATNDQAALAGLEVGRGVFLVDVGDAKKLNLYLKLIQGTYQGMKEQGVKPDFVLVFIGPSVKFLTTSPSSGVEQAAGGVLMEIESAVEALASLGIRQEVCSVATRVFGIDNSTILPGMKPVSDGFISLIGYQAQGYHLVPVF